MKSRNYRAELRDLAVLSLFGALMVVSDQLMNALPNIHLIAMFIILLTRFYRVKALYAIYVFVIADGLIEGFFLSTWVMYAYIWLILWLWVMLLPRELSEKKEMIVYPLLGALHGILFGVLGAPASYFLYFGKETWSFSHFGAYLLAGLPFDLVHMAGNFAACLLCAPLLKLLRNLRKKNLI